MFAVSIGCVGIVWPLSVAVDGDVLLMQDVRGSPEGHSIKLHITVALVVIIFVVVLIAGCGSAGSEGSATLENIADFVTDEEYCSAHDFVASRRDRPRTYLQWGLDGSEILFGHWHGIFTVAPDGSRMQQIVDASRVIEFEAKDYNPGHVESADVSWDGRRIAFSVCRKAADGRQGYDGRYTGDVIFQSEILDRENGSLKGLGLGRGVNWSPDGAWLVFHRTHQVGDDREDKEERRLHIVRADGSDQRVVTRGVRRPALWSPDGQWLAFVSGTSIMIAETNGTKLWRLTATSGTVSNPAWSPDGTRLAFARAEDQAVGLYTVGVDGGSLQRVTSVESWWQSSLQVPSDPAPEDLSLRIRVAWIPTVAWSPDGTHLLYSCGQAICVVGVDGTPLGKSPGDPRGQPLAVWSPDGTRIAVLGDPWTDGMPFGTPYDWVEIYTMAPNGDDIRVLVSVASQVPVLAGRAGAVVSGSAVENACDADSRPAAAPVGLARDCRLMPVRAGASEPAEPLTWNRDRLSAQWRAT